MARKRDEKASGRPRAGGSSSAGTGASNNSADGPTAGLSGNGLTPTRSPGLARETSARGLGKAKSASGTGGRSGGASRNSGQRVIPDAVANRMARRIAIATGIPTVMGMGVFISSYLLVSRGILDIAPAATLLASGGCFLLGLIGLSYGVLSSSWEDNPGSLLGAEQIGVNIGRLRQSIQAMRQGGTGASGGPQG